MEIKLSMTSESVGVRKPKAAAPKRKTPLSIQKEIDKLTNERAAIGEKIKVLRVELRSLKPKH